MPSASYFTLKGWALWFARPRFGTKALLVVCLSTIGLTLVTTYLHYRTAETALTKQFGRHLMAVAVSGAVAVDGDAFASIKTPEDMDSPAYREIRSRLLQLRQVNSNLRLRYVYTMSPTPKPGIWRYVVDSELPTADTFSPIGTIEDLSYNPAFLKPLDAPLAEDAAREYPGWGLLLSASAPIRDGTGRPVGILSVDAQADVLMEAVNRFRRRTLLFTCLAVLLSVLVAVLVTRQVTRPLRELDRAVKSVTLGDYADRVDIRSHDEFSDLAIAFNHMTRGLRERELYKRQFERYVSRQIAEKILANPEKAFWDAERRRATILFADIRGFTAMAEHLPPEAVVGRLNEYLSEMIDIVFAHEGTLDKFIGDAVMAVFGAPLSLGDDEMRAVKTALAMRDAARRLDETWTRGGLAGFRMGVSINTGDVVVGNIGSEKRLEYSAIGDTVNLAARIEQLNKEFKTDILISESTYRAVADRVEARFVDSVAVRGREQPVEVYELIGLKEGIL
jgi:class 3 adenylate cyclase